MDLNFSVGGWADVAVNYILDHFTPALDMIAAAIGFVTDGIQNALIAVPPFAGVAILSLLALWRVGWKFAVFTLLALASSSTWICGAARWKACRWCWHQPSLRW